jgi:hypothetical protein
LIEPSFFVMSAIVKRSPMVTGGFCRGIEAVLGFLKTSAVARNATTIITGVGESRSLGDRRRHNPGFGAAQRAIDRGLLARPGNRAMWTMTTGGNSNKAQYALFSARAEPCARSPRIVARDRSSPNRRGARTNGQTASESEP